MHERLITSACALGALLLFATLFGHGDALPERRLALPTTVEWTGDGLRGARNWLQGEGVRTLSLRERFGVLSHRHDLIPTGNLLIVTMPSVTNFRNDEAVALDQWIRSGNTLLVLAALADRPRWSQYTRSMGSDLQLLTGLNFVRATEHPADQPDARTRPSDAHPTPEQRADKRKSDGLVSRLDTLAEELPEPQQRALLPNRAHPYFEGVAQAAAFSDYPPREHTLTVPRDGFALALARESKSGAGAFWVRPDGAGTILVSGFASLFSNRALGAADNARLLSNLVAATVGPRGTVVFDDEHQGLTAAYDPAKFYRDPRLYATIATIAAVWLVWVLGATQLKMPLMRASAPREAELVRTNGMFLARVLRPAAAARLMFEHFFQHLRVGPDGGTPPQTRLWDWLENHPRLTRADVRQLRRWYVDASADRRVPLVRLRNLILVIERHLAA